ncbi:uncharacterized protein A1O9_10532 [Exophiala aquamarina CBS 119918]|uniref:Postreplication repair E3 ubiquitin-protein ligase RAD18 n=1 Tax=Exophiala aquamarina CBS 119918 TaxID=1182545 RepID=A0A072P1J8_9EURO|nr:uncharacterized protein A1O9_10532 [Exophiala aquamarina CBS 119918]KEF53557.1 hypothetical protein A1O9_10532 [Exophiala aquamarina CBS 119918]
MPEQYEVTDSTDWLTTPLGSLAQLESSLRCQVCKDFFTTPMITSCSHTFCSLCIRRYLSQEGKCPACRESDQEIKLRRNWAVEELVTSFTASRKSLLEFAQNAAQSKEGDGFESQRPKKRRKVEQAATNGAERRSTRSQSKKGNVPCSQQSEMSTPEVVLDSEDEGSVYEDAGASSPHPARRPAEANDVRVACPCCHRRMKESQINSHLDRCIAGDSSTPFEETMSPAPQLAPPGTIAYGVAKPVNQQTRLPFINYSLLNDNALRKKLRDLGIPNSGSKELMRRRHTEWVNLWNANCDSTNPVSKRRLLQDLRVWEDALGRQIDRVAGASSGFMAKDFDRQGHAKKQKDSFDDLIRQARQKRLAQKAAGSGLLGEEAPQPDGQVVGCGSRLESTPQQVAADECPPESARPPSDSTPQPDFSLPPQDAMSATNILCQDDALNHQPHPTQTAIPILSQPASHLSDLAANADISPEPLSPPPPPPAAPSARSAAVHHRMWE